MKDLDFDDMALFVRVATRGTLSAVARERQVPVSQISRSLSRIEKQCGVRLVLRSTQGLSLTDEGQTFLGYCQRITGTLEELEAEFASQTREVSGSVQVAVSPALGHFIIVPSLVGLSARHPRLQIELHSDDRLIDMAQEGVDITLRTGAPHSESMVAREIGHHGRALYASPSYLARFGRPQHPDELAAHRLITNSAAMHLNRWPFIIDGQATELPVQGHYRANSTGIMMTMVLHDLGICRCNTLIAAPLVAQGRLQPVLEDWVDVQHFPIYAMLMPQRHRLPKIQACIDYWSEWFQQMQPHATSPAP
ncbi:LysR family transcriptional regulator [Curvibacter sp. HBC28]|uniref:LysR family transcriptional regulator n=1 Tax=Curvibacter microcysteis TaxID=3026419 RepID=A0ABT5MCK4_9BURK|nr:MULTISPECIES: LysR family transcriptional regulator [unclassified Curvibacter]MDD0813632.1 LysR family transcriptional regulator [Curvibacter sp. HBC28]